MTGQPKRREEAGGCCRYWALTWVSPREVLSFGQRAGVKCPKGHRDHRICDMEMHPSREGWGKPREERGKAHTVELDAVAASQF